MHDHNVPSKGQKGADGEFAIQIVVLLLFLGCLGFGAYLAAQLP